MRQVILHKKAKFPVNLEDYELSYRHQYNLNFPAKSRGIFFDPNYETN